MSFTNVFGGSTIFPSDVSYLALAVNADVNLSWPLETTSGVDIAARIIDVTPNASGRSVYLPDATKTGAGQTILFNNVSATYTVYIKDYAGNTLATLGTSSQWQFYLSGVSTTAGTWRVFQYGAAGSGAVQPSAYAGYGLTVTGSTLSTASPVTTFSTTGTTLSAANRAGVFIWTGSGSGTLNLPAVATAGNNYFVLVRNAGGGVLTLDPAGGETINGAATLALDPKDSAVVVTDGTTWYTIGLGQDPVFAFDYTSISVTGGTYTLSGSELNRIAYKFVGVLTSNQLIVVPSTIQQYWVNNATTGSYTLGLKTSGGATTTVGQNARGIYYCDGSDVILADTASIALPISIAQGGTGGTTPSSARLSLGITAFADAIVTATTASSVRTTIVAAQSGANNDITSLAALSTPLSGAQGGTGQSSYAVGDILYASTTTALSKLADVATGNALISGGVGVAPAYGKIGLTTHISGTLPVANGGTGHTTATAAFNALAPSQAANNGKVLSTDGTNTSWVAAGGVGTVTSVALATGSTGLLVNGTTSNTITAAGTWTLTGTVVAANGGTGQSSYAVGDILYASTSTALSKLADVATGNSLISGGVGVAPAWGKITLSAGASQHVSGTLPVANGGTNLTTFTAANNAIYSTSASALTAGTLPVLAGGTGVTTSTGSGNTVLSTSPALTTPVFSSIVNTGTLTLPTSTDTLVGRATTDTLTNKTLTTPIISSIVNTGTLTLPTSTDTLVGRATTDTLTNKTLTSPVISSIVNTGTLTLPTSTDTLVGRATTDTLTNKTFDAFATGNVFKFNGNFFACAAGTATITVPNSTDTLVGRATTDTLTNKTLTSPVISSIVNTGTLTLPTSTDTLVGRATTDTLTNKTLTSPVISSIVNTGTLTLPTSTDTLVGRATTDTLTNKTLVAPALGTPVSGTLTSCTFPALSIRSYSNVRATTTSGTATVAYTADQVVMQTASGTARVVNSLSATLNLATTNAVNGRESPGTDGAGWWYVYAISNGTTDGVWLAASATAPTLPSGYTYYARIGVAYATGTAFIYSYIQRNNVYSYTSNISIVGGGTGGSSTTNPTWVAVNVVTSAQVPATACEIYVTLQLSSASGQAMAAPNNSYGAYTSSTNPPPMMLNATNVVVSMKMLLESSSVYYAFSSTNGYLRCYGFTDAI